VLAAELVFIFLKGDGKTFPAAVVESKAVGLALFGPYIIGVELASMLLLAGIVGAYYLGRKE
jgi:NADH-quinone oxidoreductase subunit J